MCSLKYKESDIKDILIPNVTLKTNDFPMRIKIKQYTQIKKNRTTTLLLQLEMIERSTDKNILW